MIKLTSGDMMHVYGSFGLKKNYTVRLTVRLTEAVEGALLEKALESTTKRYPYLLSGRRRVWAAANASFAAQQRTG